MSAFISWYLTVTLAGWLALPLAFQFFRHLPDRGYAFAKPLGLLATGYLFWFMGSLGFLRNSTGGLLFSAVCVGGLGFLWLRRAGLLELRSWLLARLGPVIAIELFFLAVFGLWALVRAYNPAILGTEKPMELMFINSVLRSPSFPPHDAWLSGHAISYYYFGYILVAALARITVTPSPVAFNLALALLFALTAVGALGVVMNLVSLARSGQAVFARRPGAALLASFWPGLLGPLLVLLVGNFYGALELVYNNGLFANLRVPAVWYDSGQATDLNQVRTLDDFQLSPGIQAGSVNFWEWLDIKGLNTPPPPRPDEFQFETPGWFNAARVVRDRNLVGIETEAIDEMPAFSFLLGDLHPHVLALPFVILSLALALEWLLWGRERAERSGSSPWPSLERLIFSGVVLGALSFLNTWDFPIYWFLTVTALLLGLGSGWGRQELLRRWRFPAAQALALLALGIALYFPFYLTFQSQAGGILPNFVYPTRFRQTVVMFGPVLLGAALFTGWAVARWRRFFDWRAAVRVGGGMVGLLALLLGVFALAAALNPGSASWLDQAFYPLSRAEGFRLAAQRRLVDSLSTLAPALMLGLAAGLLTGALRCTALAAGNAERNLSHEKPEPYREKGELHLGARPLEPGSPPMLMALAMVLTGALLLLAPEFVYLRDNFGTRMNTLFKFYFQAWVLWGLAAAFGTWCILHSSRLWVRRLTSGVMAMAVLLGLIYTTGGVLSRTGRFAGPPTLDGLAYFARDYPQDWAAIQWFEQNVSGAPVILEGTRGAYWLEGPSSRISMATGLPTVMGWTNHESQWRGPYFEKVKQREDSIRAAYTARDWATVEAILEEYHVEYVIASPAERAWYGRISTAIFDQAMQRVFEDGDLVIYQRRGVER